MKTTSILARGAAALALSTGLTLGAVVPANAAPAPAAVTAVAPSYTFNFNLLVPNAPVTFTVNGNVVGAGTTGSTGDVSFSYTPSGLAPGYYRLTATTSNGIASSVGFGVR